MGLSVSAATPKYDNYYDIDVSVPGWAQVGENYYYVADGNLVEEQWKNIDGKEYYFRFDGCMAKDCQEQIYDSANETYDYYRFNKDGCMITGLYQEDNGDFYFYGKDGKAVTEQWEKINEKYHYFEYDGRMAKDKQEEIYDSANDKYDYYHFDKNGCMVTGLYEEENGNSYYYGSDGKAVSEQWENVNGKKYYFQYFGNMAKNTESRIDNTDGSFDYYCFDERGCYITGWHKDENGDFQYYKTDGKALTRQWLNYKDKYYYFDSSATMVKDIEICIFNSSNNTSKNYRFDKDGCMITGWYKDGNGDDYYYNKDGAKLESQVLKFNNKIYGFDYNGKMIKDKQERLDNIAGDNSAYYLFDKDGCAKTGWQKDKEGNYYYYGKDGAALEDQILNWNNKTYYLGWSGKMLIDQDFWITNKQTGKDDYYHFGKDGVAKTGWYKNNYGGYCYFGTDGKALIGAHTIGGKTYCFAEDGYLLYNGIYADGTKIYKTNDEGIVTSSANMSKNGWTGFDGSYYYCQNGQLLKNQWITIGNKYYYVNYNGQMKSDCTSEIEDKSTGHDFIYGFNKSGCMMTGWQQIYDVWYNFQSSGKALTGEQKIGNQSYLFSEYGRMYDNNSIVDNTLYVINKSGIVTKKYSVTKKGWLQVGKDWYYSDGSKYFQEKTLDYNSNKFYFNYDGIMCTDSQYVSLRDNKTENYASIDKDGKFIKNAWTINKYLPYERYYSDDNGYYIKNQWLKSNNQSYYFNSNNEMSTDVAIIDGVYQLFAEDGKYIGKMQSKSGWNLIGGHYYYVENAKPVKGWRNIGGSYYYFDESGKMLSDGVKDINSTGKENADRYYFNKNGQMIASAWVKLLSYDGEANYVRSDASGKLMTGWQQIGGKWYYFSSYGYLYTNNFILNGSLQIVDNNGVFKTAVDLSKANGWKSINGNYFYYRNGEQVKGWQNIGGKYYYFDNCMFSDRIAYDNGKYYYFNKDGTWANTTGFVGDGNYYANKGVLLIGWQKLSNKWYYFNESKFNSCVAKIDGTYYRFDKNGAEIGSYKVKNGWQQVDGEWYYGVDGELVRDEALVIGTAYYCFDYDGKMVKNSSEYSVIYGEDGRMITSKWIKIDGSWYYSNIIGRVYRNETRIIAGKTYTFDVYGRML